MGKSHAPENAPKKLLIGGQTWRLHYFSEKQWKKDPELDNAHSGETWGAHFCMFFRGIKDLHPNAAKDVVLHEVLHACWFATGMTFNAKYIKKANIEEVSISAVSPTFLAVLRDNPKLVEYLAR